MKFYSLQKLSSDRVTNFASKCPFFDFLSKIGSDTHQNRFFDDFFTLKLSITYCETIETNKEVDSMCKICHRTPTPREGWAAGGGGQPAILPWEPLLSAAGLARGQSGGVGGGPPTTRTSYFYNILV